MNKTIGWFFAIVFMFLISLNISLFSSLSLLESLRIVFGSLYVLFLPGYIISYIFFPKSKPFEDDNKKKDEESSDAIDFLERIALSFALSIAVVPLAVFYLNLVGVKINLLNSFLTILGIIIISIIILIFKKFKKKET